MNITIPGLGDIDEVEVIELCVAVGDQVAENDTILVIESDKASMDVPSPVAGVIESIQVAVGDQVAEGHLIATLAAADGKADGETDRKTDREPNTASAAKQAAVESAPATQPKPTAASDKPLQIDVLVPDIGDAADVQVIEIAVQAGDVVAVDDLLVVLESDKASMEITAEQPGTVLLVVVAEGQAVEQGTHIATLAVSGQAVDQATATATEEVARKPPPEHIAENVAEQPPANAASQASPATATVAPAGNANKAATPAAMVYAGPAVRRLAREMGVDLGQVTGTGNRQRITKDDVKAFVKQQLQAPSQSAGGLPTVPVVDYAKFGPVRMEPLTRIQQRGAENLHRSWVNLPHVTQHDEADISELEAFRQSLQQEGERKGIKVTPLAFVVKAVCSAIAEYPIFNASLHADQQQLVVKDYINIGMAVDTPEGLVVPVIRDANHKSIWALSQEISDLSAKARNKKLALDDLQGGTFSISSLGALGGTGFTPIINAPEVAILGVAKMQTRPLWNGEEFLPRKVLPLSLSYDHRVINGADGGRFMGLLVSILADIRRLAL